MPWDTSDPFFSVHTRELMKLIFKCCIRQAIIFFGIPGNVLCCLVFWKQGLSDRINLLLFWLAVVDLINLTSQLSTKCACYFTDPIQIHNFSVVINATVTHIYLWAGFVSGALVVVMSVDRCLFVTMPLKARNLLTYRNFLHQGI
ncbi:uncharacterized protein LOC143290303 [Babylonia areolata]|uniref:uncharacterized protein LOC143290303 n=1 Tax=Babylonia areolata TaxID=304850 RepID=UPI003FCF5C1D